jgi:hypothetical protein
LVAQQLTCEELRHKDVPEGAYKAVIRYRKLNAKARLKRVTRVLSAVQAAWEAAKPARRRSRLEYDQDLGALLASLDDADADGVARALDRLIDKKLTLAIGDLAVSVETPKGPRVNFTWSTYRPNCMECFVGPFSIGVVEETHLHAGLFTAWFGQSSKQQQLPGQHALDVAKKRVEDRFLVLLNPE